MRITGGALAGRDLVSPGGRVRPTSEEARARIMSLVARNLSGARILDLFAGTGALGLDALSRGARSADFVEDGPAALHALKANVIRLGQRDRCRIFKRDAIPFVERLPAHAYDVAFADPPYGSKKLDRVLARWMAVPFAGVLVLEHAPDHVLPRNVPTTRLDDTTSVTILRSP